MLELVGYVIGRLRHNTETWDDFSSESRLSSLVRRARTESRQADDY